MVLYTIHFSYEFKSHVFVKKFISLKMNDDKKEVKLVVTSDKEEKAITRGVGRRRRTRKSDVERTEGGAVEIQKDIVPEPAAAVPELAPAAAVMSPPAQIIPVIQTSTVASPIPQATMSTSTVVGGSIVKIQPNKKHESATATTVATAAPKIVPHKKRVSAAPPAQTLKKPRLVVTPPPNSDNGAGGGAVVVPPKKRRFTERKISISVKPAEQTRKMRRTLKRNINSMPIAAVRRYLMRKGVLKPKATMPPEDMLRSMLKDYMLLHVAE